jgi:hypothetical protein
MHIMLCNITYVYIGDLIRSQSYDFRIHNYNASVVVS